MNKYNPIDEIQNYSIEQLRQRVVELNARYHLIVEQDNISLFRFDVKQNTMYFWSKDESQEVQCIAVDNYTIECPTLYFHESERFAIPMKIQEIINNREDKGTSIFRHRDGHQISCEYTTVKDEQGNVLTIIGQMVDLYATPSKLHETIDLLNEKVAIIEGLQSAYETVIIIDLRDYTYRLVKATEAVEKAAQMAPDVITLSKIYGQYQVKEKNQPGYYEFVNPETLSERIMGQKFLSYDYETKNIGWSHARLIPVEWDNTGLPTIVIFTTECTNEQVNEMNYLRVASENDGLTGLCNRFKGEKVIKQLLSEKRAIIFGLFDCDYFKKINDFFGHPVGDIVLIEIAKTLRNIYPNELVMRLGGDEFVVCISSPEALQKYHMNPISAFLPMRASIAQIEIPQLHGRRLSMSGGVIVYNGEQEVTFDELYKKSDEALYKAKQSHNGFITIA